MVKVPAMTNPEFSSKNPEYLECLRQVTKDVIYVMAIPREERR